jgi:NarL family two-component system sensor histidine kinase LiaS
MMKTFFARPRFTRRLWFMLTLHYTAVSVSGVMLLLGIMDITINRQNFNKAMQPDYVRSHIQAETDLLRSAADLPEGVRRIAAALTGLGMPLNNSEYYRISTSSRPEAQVVFLDQNRHLLAASTNGGLYHELLSPSSIEGGGAVQVLTPQRGVMIVMPFHIDGQVVEMRALLIAHFEVLHQLKNSLLWLLEGLKMFVLFSAAIGLVCGALAARAVTRRLVRMTEVSEAWSRSDFEVQINDHRADELADHARHLNQMAGQLKNLVGSRMKNAVNDERLRMARELHDRVKQHLFALSLQLAAIGARAGRTADVQPHLEEARAILIEAQQGLVGVIDELRLEAEPPFDELINEYCRKQIRRFGIPIEYQSTGGFEVPDAMIQPLFSISQEAVNNAIRHASPKKIVITLSRDNGRDQLVIADDGCGFDVSRASPGLGLNLIRTRAVMFSEGSFLINPVANRGTTIKISWKN